MSSTDQKTDFQTGHVGINVTDLDRAVRFYESVLSASLIREDMGGMKMAVFPHEKPGSSGALVLAPGYEPTTQGSVVYLNLSDIRPALARVPQAGGEVLLPLTPLPDEMGVFAQFRDSEGNRVGLFSRG